MCGERVGGWRGCGGEEECAWLAGVWEGRSKYGGGGEVGGRGVGGGRGKGGEGGVGRGRMRWWER